MSQLFAWGGQSIGVSPSASVPPMNTQDCSPLGWNGWISLQSKGLSRLIEHHSSKASILRCSAFFTVQLSHPYMTTGKTIGLTRRTLVGKVMSLLLNMLSRLVITFLPRSKCLLISWLQSPSAVILEPRKNKVSHCFHCFHCFPIYLPWSDGTGCHDLSFLNVEHMLDHRKKEENSRKASTSASLTTSKPLTVWIPTNCGTFLKR